MPICVLPIVITGDAEGASQETDVVTREVLKELARHHHFSLCLAVALG